MDSFHWVSQSLMHMNYALIETILCCQLCPMYSEKFFFFLWVDLISAEWVSAQNFQPELLCCDSIKWDLKEAKRNATVGC